MGTTVGERVDAAGVRAARGHPVYDVLQLDAGGGEASRCANAGGDGGALRGGGVASECRQQRERGAIG